jgi:hypothetical protein
MTDSVHAPECFRAVRPGGRYAASTFIYEQWVDETKEAIRLANLRLPGGEPVAWPQDSIEISSLWGVGPWHRPSFGRSMFQAAGFIDVKMLIVPAHVMYENVDQFIDVHQAFMHGIVERFWTKEQKEKLTHLILPTIREFMRGKYGGEAFTCERRCLCISGKKPE